MTEPSTLQSTEPSPSAAFEARWVFGSLSESLRSEVVALWLREGAIASADEAWRRSWEVAGVLIDSAHGAIAGACTVAIRLDDTGASYGFVRLFIRPGNRLLGLNRRLIRKVTDGFDEMAKQPGAPRRLVITMENRKLERRAAQRGLARLGFVETGTAANGEVIVERTLGRRDALTEPDRLPADRVSTGHDRA